MRPESVASDNSLIDLQVRAGTPRAVEAIVALAGLLVFAPFIALSAIAIAITSHGPVLFRQKRVGLGGQTFVLYKLRTMRLDSGGPLVTAGNDPRVTWIGRILRKTKLDELPELWNVLKGDMALVGPRPEVPRYVDLNSPMWPLVLKAKPGLTDPVTIRLRNEEALLAEVKGDRERFYIGVLQPYKLEGYLNYLQRRNCWSDIKVLYKTGIAIILPSRVLPPTIDEILTSTKTSARRRSFSMKSVET